MNRIALSCGGLAALASFACSPPSQGTLDVSASGSPGGAPWIDAAGPMFIEECSLGCGSGAGGVPVSCDVVGVHVNEELRVRFSRYVDLGSVNPSSFRIRRLSDGIAAAGTFTVASDDFRELVFRPALSFGPDGSPSFGFEPNAAYEVYLSGTGSNDPPPFVRSIEGRANQSRLDCTIVASEGVLDYVPGAPTHSILVDVVDPTTGRILPDQPAENAINVSIETAIDVVFADVMDVSTLVNPSTGEAPFLEVEVDLGNPLNEDSRFPVAGTWSVQVEFDPPRTIATFVPDEPLPARAMPTMLARYVVVSVPFQIADLSGNLLADPGSSSFRTQEVDYAPTVLPQPGGETFDDGSNEDAARSGADWGSGRLTFGHGGGSGRLGQMVVRAGEELDLATAGETFPVPGTPYDVLTNAADFSWSPSVPGTWPTVEADERGLEFSLVRVEEGGRLRLSGADAARLFARGVLEVEGTLDVAGGDAPDHRSNSGGGNQTSEGILTAAGGTGGSGGPGAGAGGQGADRLDQTENLAEGCQTTTMVTVGGILIPNTPDNPGTDNDGRVGAGVGGTSGGGGRGGTHWPPATPRTITTIPSACLGDFEATPLLNPVTGTVECRVAMVGGAGSGGGYARDGAPGFAFSPITTSQPGLTPLAPPPTVGGDSAEVGLEPPGSFPPLLRDLDWYEGELRGGSGGGGGGLGVWGTKTNATTAVCTGPGANMFPFFDHSAAGGGGGGGALQAVAGRSMSILGRIDAAGGDGGGALDPATSIFDCTNATTDPSEACGDFAAPGGGGSGGAIKLQAIELELAYGPARLSVIGGTGGISTSGSLGGDGGPGLVRIESVLTQLLPEALAPSIEPYLPGELGFNQPYVSAAILSLGDWESSELRPESFSASSSCWMRSDELPFELIFAADTGPFPEQKGWNLDVLYDTGSDVVLFPYRGISFDPTYPLTGTDFENFLGTDLNHDELPGEGSLFCVRFQGARAAGPLDDPCDVDLHADAGEIVPGSLTPWVRHPMRLNDFTPNPNMIRFAVVFDRSLADQGPIQASIRGITNLRVDVQPD